MAAQRPDAAEEQRQGSAGLAAGHEHGPAGKMLHSPAAAGIVDMGHGMPLSPVPGAAVAGNAMDGLSSPQPGTGQWPGAGTGHATGNRDTPVLQSSLASPRPNRPTSAMSGRSRQSARGSVQFVQSPAEDPLGASPAPDGISPGFRRGSITGSVGRRSSVGSASGRMSRRGSLATMAYQQAMENNRYRERTDEEMEHINKDSEDIEAFLRRRNSWKEGCSHSIAEFASQIREACGAKKAAEKFLRGALGRGLTEQPEKRKNKSMGMWSQMAGPSAILEWAARSEDEKDQEHATAYTKTRPTTSAVLPSRMRATPDKQRERNGMIRRFRPGTADNERLSTPQTGQTRTSKPPDSAAVSGQSPAHKYPQLLSPRREKMSQVTARAAWEQHARRGRGPRAMAHFPRQQDRLTEVTGAVDYASLLQDQAEQRRSLADHDIKYDQMMVRFDEINYLNQRKLSKLLKPGVGIFDFDGYEDRMGAPEKNISDLRRIQFGDGDRAGELPPIHDLGQTVQDDE